MAKQGLKHFSNPCFEWDAVTTAMALSSVKRSCVGNCAVFDPLFALVTNFSFTYRDK